MHDSAHPKIEVLITDISTHLGAALAKRLLESGVAVYGLGKKNLPPQLLIKKNFTLLDLDLSQPLPNSLPRFEQIFHIATHETHSLLTPENPTSPVLRNLLDVAAQSLSRVAVIIPVNCSANLLEFLAARAKAINQLNLFLIGDTYGPDLDLSENSILTSLISQALFSNKIILPNEGLDTIFPTYADDATAYLASTIFEPRLNEVKIQTIVSNAPQNALTIAYTIQKISMLLLNKEIGLFFSGTPQDTKLRPAAPVEVHKLSHATAFEQGLTNTFSSLASHSRAPEAPLPVDVTPARERINYQQFVPQEDKYKKFKNFKKPKISFRRPGIKSSKSRLTTVAVIGLVLFFLIKTVAETIFGINNLKSAKTAIETTNWPQAVKNSQSALSELQSAAGKIKIITTPLGFVLPSQVNSLNNTFQSLISSAKSLSSFSIGSQALSHNVTLIAHKDSIGTNFDYETPKTSYKSALNFATQAQLYAALSQKGTPFKGQTAKLVSSTQSLATATQLAYDLSNLLVEFTGSTVNKSYLLLMQNNTELRPGGGFIGNVGQIEFENGKLKNISVDDVYNIDGQLKEKLEPPKPLKDKLGVTQFYLRDSNWNPDFTQNAQLARDFFKKETGKSVDGVIAIDLNFMEEVLKATGPIKLADYNEEITAENLFDRGEFYSEIGFFPGSTQKKDFFGALSRALITRIIQSFSTLEGKKDASGFSFLKFIDAVKSSIDQKHLMMAFDNTVISAYTKTGGLDASLPPTSFNPTQDETETRDFLALSEANVGANKVNRYITRNVSYEMTIGRDADLVAKLKIAYTNNSQAETWPGGKYVNYLRVYAPIGAGLLEYKNGDEVDPKKVEVTNLGALTSFAAYVEVPIKSTREVTFTYRIPKNIKLETAPTYHLYVEKQAGTGKDPFEFKFNLPNYLSATKVNGKDQTPPASNLAVKTTLETDRQFEIQIVKK